MKWINRFYILFLGIILSITTGFGVAAFYPQPIPPIYPTSTYPSTIPQSCYATPQSQASADCQALFNKQQVTQQHDEITRQKYESDLKIYQNKSSGYNRTAIFFGIAIGALFAILGLALIKKSKIIATSLLLAGVLTAVFTRILIILASLGASVSGTTGADIVSYMEFGVLLILSVAVIGVGFMSLKENEITLQATATNPPQKS